MDESDIRTMLLDGPFPDGLRSPLCLGMPARGPPPFFLMGLLEGGFCQYVRMCFKERR